VAQRGAAVENRAGGGRVTGEGLIDVNVSLGRWPFQWFDPASAAQLDAHLAAEGIAEAWVGSMDAVLYPDVDACDEQLARQIEPFARLRMVKTINPVLGNWRDSFERAADDGIHAIKLYPNYHQYALSDSRAYELASLAGERGIIVLLPLRIDDERNQYPLMKVPAVDARDVVALASVLPRTIFIVLGTLLPEWDVLRAAGNVMVEVSFVEFFQTLAAGLRAMPVERIVFGSHTPMFTTRSAVLKWRLANTDDVVRGEIGHENVRRLSDRQKNCEP
jgi:predicted TIM-barrel fold metal-dependent hydrolase